MAHRRSAIKKIRIDKKRHIRNSGILSALRTQMKKTNRLITEKKMDEAIKDSRELC